MLCNQLIIYSAHLGMLIVRGYIPVSLFYLSAYSFKYMVIIHLFVSYMCSIINLSPIVQESIESANTTIEDDDVKGRGFALLNSQVHGV